MNTIQFIQQINTLHETTTKPLLSRTSRLFIIYAQSTNSHSPLLLLPQFLFLADEGEGNLTEA